MATVIQYGSAVSDHSRDRTRADVAELFDRHYVPLRRLAFVMLGDPQQAEEVVMEAFVKVFSGWNRFRNIEHLPAYLRRTVVNGCRGRIRRRRIEGRAAALLHGRAEREAADWGPERSELQADVWTAVRALPERQRACIVLRYLEDLSDAQIAETLDCSIGTVKSQLAKARAKLQTSLAYLGEVDERHD
jgi:RNA polymerase sigma-70 factor (sigma-E family)